MQCSNPECENNFDGTDPMLTVNVGDLSAGSYWGCFCSYQCALLRVGNIWMHLDNGGKLKDLASGNNTVVGQATKPGGFGGVGAGATGFAAATGPKTPLQEAKDKIAENKTKVFTLADKLVATVDASYATAEYVVSTGHGTVKTSIAQWSSPAPNGGEARVVKLVPTVDKLSLRVGHDDGMNLDIDPKVFDVETTDPTPIGQHIRLALGLD